MRLQELAEAAAAGEGLPDEDPRATAQLRRACGDPLFFENLKESIGSRRRDGNKFLTHEEEMDLGTKVQRYRRLTEVSVVVIWAVRQRGRRVNSVVQSFGRSTIRSVIQSDSRPRCRQLRRSVARSVAPSVGL